MTANFDKLREIFLAVLEQAPDQRNAYLDQHCAGDESLRRSVAVMLKAHAAEEGPLDRGPLQNEQTRAYEQAAERPGTVIGPYKLLEQIGEGGMGIVFMAEQSRPLRRKVALKVIKPGMDTKQVIARFDAERQALALMDHPNIARVLEAGTTDSGRPYFVMELVKGIPITEYCDQARLTPRQRLELFHRVCLAVQHAHQKGIIHRDLKPGNVLVTLRDGEPVPKVIDFGIAKAVAGVLDPGYSLTDRTLFTGFAQMVGTPLYMSPEQAALSATDVDTRSDVYSLGVLLYELLTGTTPFENETLKRAGYDEMRRIIREQEPPRPSTRLTTLAQASLSTVAEQRGVEPKKLREQVHGELDWIVMKALEKDRDRRYESASALAADVARYLSGDTVEACPPSAYYRLQKYVHRNRRLLVPLVVIAAVLATATAVSAWLAIEANAARQLADERLDNEKKARSEEKKAQNTAVTESAIARAVNDFLQHDLLRQVGSVPQISDEISGDPNLTVKEALDRAAIKIGSRFRNQPLVEAAVRMAIGLGYFATGQNELAALHLERAVALRQANLGMNHPDTFESMCSLSEAYGWMGRHADAIFLLQELLEQRKALLGPDHCDTLVCAQRLTKLYRLAGQWNAELQLAEPLFEKCRTALGPTHSQTLEAKHGLAMAYADVGRLAEALALNEELLQYHKSRNELNFFCMETYAVFCQWAGEFQKADHVLREALVMIRNREDGMPRRRAAGNFRGWLALNLVMQARCDEAEPFARQAVAIFEKLRPEDVRRFYWVSVLGAVLLGQQKYFEAEPFLLQGYEGMKQRETIMITHDKRRMAQAGEWVIRFYEATKQPEKARIWREKLDGEEPFGRRAPIIVGPHPEKVSKD